MWKSVAGAVDSVMALDTVTAVLVRMVSVVMDLSVDTDHLDTDLSVDMEDMEDMDMALALYHSTRSYDYTQNVISLRRAVSRGTPCFVAS